MNTETLKRYHSPLRQAQAGETRERLLRAAARLLEDDPDSPLAFADLARAAGVQERTAYRHFPSKEALLDAFWAWVNERAGFAAFPESEADLVEQPRVVFAGFDRVEGVVRASLASRAGREMRLRRVPERRAAFARSLADATGGLDPVRARQVLAVVQALYSAPAWQAMRDFSGLTGAEAGEAASWAIRAVLDAARREAAAAAGDRGPADPARAERQQQEQQR
jgi:AcrR family transcriptional regulator